MINPRRGEVWLVNFHPQVGDEIRKARPALVLSADGVSRLELRIIVPITDWKEGYRNHYTKVELLPSSVNGLSKASAADGFQIKSLSLARFVESHPIGRLTLAEVEDICTAVRIATGMNLLH